MRHENFGEEHFGMTEFIRNVNVLMTEDLNDLFQGNISVLMIDHADEGTLKNVVVLEEQDLYGEKIVKVGTANPEEMHVCMEPNMLWHNDRIYSKDMHPFVGLYCVSFGEGSSPTYFCDLKKSYQNLSQELKETIEDYKCTFAVKTYQGEYPHQYKTPVYERAFNMKAKATHNIVRRDKFGEYLFFSPSYATPPFVDELVKQAFPEEDQFVHYWKPGQLIIWNNFTVTHKRDSTPYGVDRRLIRYAFHEQI